MSLEVSERKRILVGDNDLPVLDMEKFILESLGYKVRAFQDPEELLAEFQRNPLVSGILSDYDYRHPMTGTELIEAIVRHCEQIKQTLPRIAMVTGNSNEGIERVEQLEALGIRIIHKPDILPPIINLFTSVP